MQIPRAALVGLVMAGLAGSVSPAQAGLITLTVAPGGGANFTSLSAAVAAANADLDLANTYHIELAAGIYVNDYANVRRPMEIVGAGADQTVLQSTQALPNKKGIIHTTASLLVKGVTLAGAYISDALGGNGAGIRDQMTGAGTLRVEDTVFRGNQEGILSGGSGHQEQVIIKNSKFLDNGNTGREHGIYIGDAASLAVTDSVFCGQSGGGHNIKSRAQRTTISGVDSYEGVLADGCTRAGTASRGIDLSNGGVVSITDTDLYQASASPNWSLLAYAPEGLKHVENSLALHDVNFVNTRANGVGIQWFGGTNPCTLDGVSFTGVAAQSTPQGGCGVGTVIPPVVEPTSPIAVAEPGSLALLLAGLAGLAGTIRRIRPAA